MANGDDNAWDSLAATRAANRARAKTLGKTTVRIATITGNGLLKGATYAGKGAVKGATLAGGAVVIGATYAGKGAVKGATLAGKGAIKGATLAGKGAVLAGGAVVAGATYAGKGAAKGAVLAGKGAVKGAALAGTGAEIAIAVPETAAKKAYKGGRGVGRFLQDAGKAIGKLKQNFKDVRAERWAPANTQDAPRDSSSSHAPASLAEHRVETPPTTPPLDNRASRPGSLSSRTNTSFTDTEIATNDAIVREFPNGLQEVASHRLNPQEGLVRQQSLRPTLGTVPRPTNGRRPLPAIPSTPPQNNTTNGLSNLIKYPGNRSVSDQWNETTRDEYKGYEKTPHQDGLRDFYYGKDNDKTGFVDNKDPKNPYIEIRLFDRECIRGALELANDKSKMKNGVVLHANKNTDIFLKEAIFAAKGNPVLGEDPIKIANLQELQKTHEQHFAQLLKEQAFKDALEEVKKHSAQRTPAATLDRSPRN